jgi:hypothetical protein
VGTDVRTKSKEEAVRTQQATAGMEYAVLEKRCTQSLKRESSFWSFAARRKEADRVDLKIKSKKRKKGDEECGCELPTQSERAREGEKHRQQSNTA